jgi:hypothetical protein
MNIPDTEWDKIIMSCDRLLHTPDGRTWMQSKEVREILERKLTSRDTYWKERVRKEVDELWHDLGKYQGWLGGVMGNETDFTLMQQQPTKEVREAKALHTAIIMKAKEKVHQTQMKVKSLLDNLK